MSDPEDDREFLEEIKALEDVLANEETSSVEIIDKNITTVDQPEIVVRRKNPSSRGFGEVEPQRESRETINLENGNSAYETNKKLIELLRETKRELLMILERCVENKTIINAKIHNRANSAKSSRVLICTAGMPYFKDAKHFPAPLNNDMKKKIKNAEFQVVHLRYTCPWTAKDRNILWRAIRQEAAADVLERERLADNAAAASSVRKNDKEEADEKRNNGNVVFAERSRDRVAESLNLPKNFKAMIGPLRTREFDWLKIAAMDFDERHTADECRVMWQVFLHPDVNRYRWTREEDSLMEELCIRYKAQNWDALANELNTQRSGYQCFIRYNSINRKIQSDDRIWSAYEDERMRACVEKFKIGHYIPWGTVARYMGSRSKGQVYYRWMYNTAPRLKKGRFTEEEDARLLEAVREYGKNFCKISACVMTNRSSVQLSDHYHTLIIRKRGIQNSWSINEDARLLVLHNKYGPDWSKIARKISGKTRTQVRHRHKAIIRYWDKGVSLYEIPRDYKNNIPRLDQRDNNDDEEDDDDDEISEDANLIDRLERNRMEKYSSEMEQIDLELIKYFQLIPGASKPGRKRKYYCDEELEDMTKKLCIILKALGANLVITEESEERTLTEKDKQLINSLNDYQRLQSENMKFPNRDWCYGETYGDEKAANNREKHFAALCPGDCNQREKLRWHDNIDYVPPPTLDHCQITLNMKLDTPETIVQLVGDEKNLDFDKLKSILISRNDPSSEQQQNVFEKKYFFQPRVCSKIVSTVERETFSGDSSICEILQTHSANINKKRRGTKKEIQWNSSTSDGIIQRLDQPFSCVEPNYYTLLGLQHIISKPKTSFESDFTEQVYTTSDEGKRSMGIFKKRLVQLFKYPIGLSHIIRPEIYVGRNIDDIELANEKTTIVDGIADDSPKISSPPTKRKRYLNA